MKTLSTISAILFASVLAFSATAIASTRVAPQTAVESNTMVQAVQANLASQGYVLGDVLEQPLVYIVTPRAPYNWGQIVYTYSRPGATLAIREELQVTVKLKYLSTGVAVPELDVREVLAE
jgi:hypothetical protein